MISKVQWSGFEKQHDVVGCFISVNGAFLILQRGMHKPQGGTWGIPGGKVEKNERLIDAVIRETTEETGLVFTPDKIRKLSEFFVNIGTYDFVYHVYEIKLETIPTIQIDSTSHTSYKWVTPEQALVLPLIGDLDTVIKETYIL
ncbi:MAG: NUDIX hydrolase [bacterium]